METQSLSRALIPLPGQERIVRRGFWKKVGAALNRVPFLDRLIAAFYAAVDPATPAHAKAILFAALAYFVLPADLIPDFIAGLGFSDDGAVLFLAMQTLSAHITADHLDRARQYLAEQAGEG